MSPFLCYNFELSLKVTPEVTSRSETVLHVGLLNSQRCTGLTAFVKARVLPHSSLAISVFFINFH